MDVLIHNVIFLQFYTLQIIENFCMRSKLKNNFSWKTEY